MLSYHRIIVISVFLTKLVCNNSQHRDIECDWSVEHQQCPTYGTTDWHCLQSKLNCTNEEKYHCVRNERGKLVEICDKGKVCEKGQEPVYSTDSRIECRNCSDPERYELAEGKLSYKFSECSRKKTACPKDSLECPDEKAKHIQNRKCRCMYEKDFIPQGYDFTKDVWKCADSNNLICVKEVCPESVDGRFQSRGADYGCSLAVKPVTLAPTDTPVIRSSTEASPHDTSTTENPIDGANRVQTLLILIILVIVFLVFGVLIMKCIQKSVLIMKCIQKSAPEIPRQVAAKFDKETECIHLLWYEPENDGGKPIEDYCVEYSKIDEEEWKKSEPVAETRWMVGNLEGGVKYRFRVCARNAVGSSSYREAENPVTFCSVPDKPNMITVKNIESNQVTLTWEAPINDGGLEIKSYHVRRKQEGYEWEEICECGKTCQTTLQVGSLLRGKTYWVGVCAENDMGLGEFKDYEKEVKLPKQPDPPGELKAEESDDNEVLLSWNHPEYDGGSPITCYKVKVKENSGLLSRFVEYKTDPGIKEIRIKYLKAGTKCHFSVCAENKYGTSVPKEEEFTTKKLVPPDAPGKLKAEESDDNEVFLSWTHPEYDGGSPITCYIVKAKEKSGLLPRIFEDKKDIEDKTDPRVTEFHFKKLKAGTKYCFSVCAENKYGTSVPKEMNFTTKKLKDVDRDSCFEKEGNSMDEDKHDSGMVVAAATRGSVSTKQSVRPPSKPSGPLTASVVNDTELILTWNPPDFDGGSPVTAYFLNVQCEEKDWDFLAEIPAGHEKFLSHRVKHLNRNTKYRFSVKAINQWGPSDYLEMEEQIQTKAITENHEESHTKGTEPVANMNKGDILQQAECDEVSLPEMKRKKAEEYLVLLKSSPNWEKFCADAGGIQSLLGTYGIIPFEKPLKLKTPIGYKTRKEGIPDGFYTFEFLNAKNSLFISVSLLLYGSEDYTSWLQLAAAHDGISSYNFYKSQLFGDRSEESILKAMDACLSQESREEFCKDKKGDRDYLREFFLQMVIRETAALESKCNTMQVQFLSSVTGYWIVQYFEKGTVDCFGDFTKGPKIVIPVSKTHGMDHGNNDFLYIYWRHDPKLDPDSKRGDRVINSAVPLIKIKGVK